MLGEVETHSPILKSRQKKQIAGEAENRKRSHRRQDKPRLTAHAFRMTLVAQGKLPQIKTSKFNINQKIASKKSSPSRHLGSLSGAVLRKRQEGKDFQVKSNDFGTDFGAHFLLALLVFFGQHLFWTA